MNEKIREFEVGEGQLKDKCPVCLKKFKLGEKFVLCPIQAPRGDYFINSIAIPIHVGCYYVEDS